MVTRRKEVQIRRRRATLFRAQLWSGGLGEVECLGAGAAEGSDVCGVRCDRCGVDDSWSDPSVAAEAMVDERRAGRAAAVLLLCGGIVGIV